jgi:iron(III) transport system substrate-binding protein
MQKHNWLRAGLFAAAASAAFAAAPAQAQGSLVMYCGVQEEWCRAMSGAFEKQTGISVAMVRLSSGETYAQAQARKRATRKRRYLVGRHGRPASAGGIRRPDPGIQSPARRDMQDWAVKQAGSRKIIARSASMPARSAGATTAIRSEDEEPQ